MWVFIVVIKTNANYVRFELNLQTKTEHGNIKGFDSVIRINQLLAWHLIPGLASWFVTVCRQDLTGPLGPSEVCALAEVTKVFTISSFFLSLSPSLTFLPEGVVEEF